MKGDLKVKIKIRISFQGLCIVKFLSE